MYIAPKLNILSEPLADEQGNSERGLLFQVTIKTPDITLEVNLPPNYMARQSDAVEYNVELLYANMMCETYCGFGHKEKMLPLYPDLKQIEDTMEYPDFISYIEGEEINKTFTLHDIKFRLASLHFDPIPIMYKDAVSLLTTKVRKLNE